MRWYNHVRKVAGGECPPVQSRLLGGLRMGPRGGVLNGVLQSGLRVVRLRSILELLNLVDQTSSLR